MKFELPRLNYGYDALEPHIDARTMEIHYTKHHQAYVDKLNTALEKYPDLRGMSVEDLLKNLDTLKVEEADCTAIRNHGGGHANHSLFWKLLDPANQKNEALTADIVATFGTVDDFKKQFTDAAVKVFGSGWAWLARDASGTLSIYGLANQDSPYLKDHTPIFGLDVWEHSYYLKYQNKRLDYVQAFWNILKLI